MQGVPAAFCVLSAGAALTYWVAGSRRVKSPVEPSEVAQERSSFSYLLGSHDLMLRALLDSPSVLAPELVRGPAPRRGILWRVGFITATEGAYSMPMSKKLTVQEKAHRLTSAVRLAEFRKTRVEVRRNEFVFELRESGYSARKISIVLDLTEGRVYQILRAGRGAQSGRMNEAEALLQISSNGDLVSAVALHEDEGGFFALEEF